MIISEATYDITDPTIDSQMVKLKASGADMFLNLSTPKFAALAIRKMGELGWKPMHVLNNVSSSVGAVIKPAGLEYRAGRDHRELRQGSDRPDLGRTIRA